MKILVTGGAGFIGSHIVDAYVKSGHDVVIIDNLSSGKKANINPGAKFYQSDINSPELEKMFSDERFHVLNHHAAQIDVRKSVSDPIFDASVNILGSLHLFELARKHGLKKVIFASSGGTIYGECGSKAPNETADARPLSPYGIAKYSVEFYLKFYQAIQGLAYTVLRYANVYGPRQDPHGEAGVVAIFSGKLIKNEAATIFGDGKQMRDYVYVSDVVRANLLSLEKGDNEIFNIGAGEATSVNRLFEVMAAITSSRGKAEHKPARPGELLKSFLNGEKARKILGWKPEESLRSGLEKTIAYFQGKESGSHS